MATSDRNFSFEYRFSQQLEALSCLSESLTLKILELEERLKELENKKSIFANQPQEILRESEERMEYLQSLLDLLPSKGELINPNKENPGDIQSDSSDSDNLCEILNHQVDSIDAGETMEDISEVNSKKEVSAFQETDYLDDPQMPLISA